MNNLEKYMKPLSEKYFTVISFTTIIQVILFLTCFILKKSSLILHIIPFSFVLFMYITLKDYAKSDKEKNISLTITKASCVIMILAFANNGILSVINKLANTNPNALSTSNILILLVDTMLILVALAAFMHNTLNEKITEFHNKSTKSFLGGEEEEQIMPGDAVIGYTLEDNKPVILPLKDRYLHMLIIG